MGLMSVILNLTKTAILSTYHAMETILGARIYIELSVLTYRILVHYWLSCESSVDR